ncbi:MAG TPA: hypothetical protein VMT44_05835 [Methanoregula sp.]|nr:hypothetical protein [Methanoregula sp.]
MTPDDEIVCPQCGRADLLSCTDDLGSEGRFYRCCPKDGCGTTFRLAPDGGIEDIF